MPLGKNEIPRHVELLLEELFDRALAAESKIVFLPCAKSRATYLHNWAKFLKTASAVASIEYLDDSDPNFGRGSYWYITTHPTEEGLYVRALEEEKMDLDGCLIKAAFQNKDYSFECESPEAAQQTIGKLTSRKRRLQKKTQRSQFDLVLIYRDSNFPNIVRISAATPVDKIQEVPGEKLEQVKRELSRAGWGTQGGKKSSPDS